MINSRSEFCESSLQLSHSAEAFRFGTESKLCLDVLFSLVRPLGTSTLRRDLDFSAIPVLSTWNARAVGVFDLWPRPKEPFSSFPLTDLSKVRDGGV